MEAIEQVPKTALDVFRLLREGTLCEVIDNVLYLSPAPTFTHQRLLLLIARKISDNIEKTNMGEAFISPVDVYFTELSSAVQPDLIFVSKANMGIMNEDGYFYGAPDLIVEVLSSGKKRDTVTKKNLYQKAGVKEYLIADPANRKVLGYLLNNGKYDLVYEDEGFFTSHILQVEFTF